MIIPQIPKSLRATERFGAKCARAAISGAASSGAAVLAGRPSFQISRGSGEYLGIVSLSYHATLL